MKKGTMPHRTISETLFEQFCDANAIRYSRIEREGYRTPDYDLYFSEHLVVAEIKELGENKHDKEVRQKTQRGDASFWSEESGRRVRAKIDSAKTQIRKRAKGKYPTILILYDNVSVGCIDSEDIKVAMYGHEQFNIAVPHDHVSPIRLLDHRFGSKRKFTLNQNTTFSAIGWLYKFAGVLRLVVYHNYYASIPIDPDWVRRDAVTHRSLDPTSIGFQEWREL